MSTAKMTLIGLYQYDNTLFDNMTMPAGIDKSLLVDNILLKSGDFETLYGDLDFIKDSIGIWSRKWYRTFTKWFDALQLEYDPISNYDRHEEWQTDDTGSQSSHSIDNSTATITGTNTDKVSAYNSNALVDDKSNSSNSTSGSNASSNLSGSHANKELRTGRAWGNIGVTTSQQMLQAELDISQWNLYEHITDVFLSEFIIPVF